MAINSKGLASAFQMIVTTISYALVVKLIISDGGLELLGLWSLTIGTVSLMRVIDLTGATSLVRLVAISDDEERKQVVDTVTIFSLFFFTILSIILYFPTLAALKDVGSTVTPLTLQILIAVCYASAVMGVLNQACCSTMDGLGRADIRSLIGIASAIIYILVSYIFFHTYGILVIAIAQFLQFLFSIILLRLVSKLYIKGANIFPANFTFGCMKQVLSYSVKLQSAASLALLFDIFCRYTLARYFGLSAAGYFDISNKLTGNIRAILQAYQNPKVEWYAKRWKVDEGDTYRQAIVDTKLFSITVILSFVLGIISSPFVSIYFIGNIDQKLIFYITVLSCGWCLSTVFLNVQLLGKAIDKMKWIIIGYLSYLITAPISIYVGYLFQEEIVSVIGLSLSIIVTHCIMMYGTCRYLKFVSPVDL